MHVISFLYCSPGDKEGEWERRSLELMTCIINGIHIALCRVLHSNSTFYRAKRLQLWCKVCLHICHGQRRVLNKSIPDTPIHICSTVFLPGRMKGQDRQHRPDPWVRCLSIFPLTMSEGLNASPRDQPGLMECCYTVWVALWPVDDCTYFPRLELECRRW